MRVKIDLEHLQTLVSLAEACTDGSQKHKEHVDAIAAGNKAIDDVAKVAEEPRR